MTDAVTREVIEGAEQDVRNARAALQHAEQRLLTLQITRAQQVYDINVGDIVRDATGRVGKVVAIKSYLSDSAPNVEVRVKNKNGEFGKYRIMFRCWKKVIP